MLEKILDYLRRYFIDTRELFTAVETDGITGTFSETYVTGQYISIDKTKVNDGVYKVLSATTSKITLDATLTAETDVYGIVWGLAVPKKIITLATEIDTYNSASQKGIMSESQGNRSVSYGNGNGGGSSSWQSVYKDELAPYKQMYSDKLRWCSHVSN